MTKNGRPLFRYKARFQRLDKFDQPVIEVREVTGVNEFQARKKVEGIATKNGWVILSFGRA